MDKEKILKRLYERRNDCEELHRIINEIEYKNQLFGEILGIDYAIGLLVLEDE